VDVVVPGAEAEEVVNEIQTMQSKFAVAVSLINISEGDNCKAEGEFAPLCPRDALWQEAELPCYAKIALILDEESVSSKEVTSFAEETFVVTDVGSEKVVVEQADGKRLDEDCRVVPEKVKSGILCEHNVPLRHLLPVEGMQVALPTHSPKVFVDIIEP
jgi:hypothetical protein